MLPSQMTALPGASTFPGLPAAGAVTIPSLTVTVSQQTQSQQQKQLYSTPGMHARAVLAVACVIKWLKLQQTKAPLAEARSTPVRQPSSAFSMLCHNRLSAHLAQLAGTRFGGCTGQLTLYTHRAAGIALEISASMQHADFAFAPCRRSTPPIQAATQGRCPHAVVASGSAQGCGHLLANPSLSQSPPRLRQHSMLTGDSWVCRLARIVMISRARTNGAGEWGQLGG
jgi:hypothetical protein